MNRIVTAIVMAIVALPAFAFGFKADEVFVEGMRWEGLNYVGDPVEPFWKTVPTESFIKGETEFLGKKCLKLWHKLSTDTDDEAALQMYLRVENDIVYYVDNSQATEWDVLYDFKIQPPYTTDVKIPSQWDSGFDVPWQNVTLQHLANFRVMDATPQYEVMLFEEADGSFLAQWIRGFGNVGFPEDNVVGIDGHAPGQLIRAVCNGRVLYENKTADVSSIMSEQAQVSTIGRLLQIRNIAAGTPLTVYRPDGSIVTSTTINQNIFDCELPGAGLYIVSAGNNTVKVLAK